MRRALARVERWSLGAYRASLRDLAAFRVLLASYLLFRYLPQGRHVIGLPRAFYDPPLSLAALARDFPSAPLLLTLNVVAALALLALLLGHRTRAASVASTLSLVTLQSFSFATGKIDHSILVLLTPLVLATSGWGRLWSLDARGAREAERFAGCARGRFELAWLALTVSVGMATAGLAKLYTGWLDPTISSTYGHGVANAWLSDRHTWLGDLLLRPALAPLWEPLDWATVGFELLAPLTIVRARWFRGFCLVACCFHLGVGLTMDIWFGANVVVYAAFLPWGALLRRTPLRLPRLVPALIAVFALALLAAGLEWWSDLPVRGARDLLSRALVTAALPVALWFRRAERRTPGAALAPRLR